MLSAAPRGSGLDRRIPRRRGRSDIAEALAQYMIRAHVVKARRTGPQVLLKPTPCKEGSIVQRQLMRERHAILCWLLAQAADVVSTALYREPGCEARGCYLPPHTAG